MKRQTEIKWQMKLTINLLNLNFLGFIRSSIRGAAGAYKRECAIEVFIRDDNNEYLLLQHPHWRNQLMKLQEILQQHCPSSSGAEVDSKNIFVKVFTNWYLLFHLSSTWPFYIRRDRRSFLEPCHCKKSWRR